MQVNVNSASGRLEGIYKKSEKPNAPCALLLHPHPLYGGAGNFKPKTNLKHSIMHQHTIVCGF